MPDKDTQQSIHGAVWFIQAIILALSIERFVVDLSKEIVGSTEITRIIFLLIFVLFSVVLALELFYATEWVEKRSDTGEALSHLFNTFAIFPVIFIFHSYDTHGMSTRLMDNSLIGLIFFFIMFLLVRIVDIYTNVDRENENKNYDPKVRLLIVYSCLIIVLATGVFFNITSNIELSTIFIVLSLVLYYFVAYIFPKFIFDPYSIADQFSNTLNS